jgi:enolase
MPNVKSIRALEVLDSRGNPTVRTFVSLDNDITTSSTVPSGASTGTYEAYELRDGDEKRYFGAGVEKAVSHVNDVLARALVGKSVDSPISLDKMMLSLDGSENKSHLGANAILSVSQALLKAAALANKQPLWQFIHEYFFHNTQPNFPRLMVNIVNGGKHANWNFDIQEFMIIPKGSAPSSSVRTASEIFHSLGKMIVERQLSPLLGDEGGYSPAFSSNEEVLDNIIDAAKKLQYENDHDYHLGLDCAATEWVKDGQYYSHKQDKSLSVDELLDYYLHLRSKYRILSFEDPFAEDDWDAFTKLTEHAHDFQTVGDDLYVTNPKRLTKGIDHHATNAILIKPNQIGTISETVEAIQMARDAHMKIIISHRSGDTEDSFIADLAYGSGADFIKTGSMSRSERVAKYNRLLEIEQHL